MSAPIVGDIWYRYEDHKGASFNLDGDCWSSNGQVRISLTAFWVVRLTPKGVWLTAKFWATSPLSDKGQHWVSLTATKKYANATPRLAMIDFLARKARQRGIYKARLTQADQAHKMGTNMLKGLEVMPE